MQVGYNFIEGCRALSVAILLVAITGCSGGASLDPAVAIDQPEADPGIAAPAVGLPQTDDDGLAPVAEPAPELEPEPASQEPEPVQSEEDESGSAPSQDSPVAASEPEVPEQTVWSAPIDGPYQLSDITDLVLLTGQSNALGAGTSYDPSLDGSDSRVLAYTNHGWQIADLHQIWDLGWHPGNDGSEAPSNNLALHFGKRMTQLTEGDRVFGFVLATAPGQPIAHWQRDGEFYQSIQRKVLAALAEHPTKNQLDGILWHQGESDANGGESYARALSNLIGNFRAESWFSGDRPFICGETAQFAVNAQLMALNHDADPWTACIAAAGLPTHEDGAHFLAEALRTMGQRYADVYNQMWWQSPR